MVPTLISASSYIIGAFRSGNDTIMLAAGWTVLLSVIAHGVTANPLVKKIGHRSADLRASANEHPVDS
jgi:NhaP-type Na+/H+ or K+/H+ antiporter